MVDEMDPEELEERLTRGADVQVIDIRGPDSFAEGHIPGATNVPLGRFAREIEDQEFGDEVVVACPLGESSLQAARLLESYEGVDEETRVANLAGGYEAWDGDLEGEP
ncbi:rhodanese-like domain-containing protein [Halobacteriales archaeon SW_10_68_16]|jgi:thiosulfate/3-mercaptopyruvate sulfurtransferase|nr:MAG: rhodanese-like domain-containing protein [Halobacteriales archaeon SW_10_68_16]